MVSSEVSVLTPEAMASEIAHVQAISGSLRVVGSLGRGALYGHYIGEPDYEYSRRRESPLGTPTKPRDIDIIGLDADSLPGSSPFEVDSGCFSNDYVAIVAEGDDWFLIGPRSGFAEPLHPDVMQPFEGETVFGIPCRTLPIQTSRIIYGMQGMPRDKDIFTRSLLDRLADSVDSNYLLPEPLFEPFSRLQAVVNNDWTIRLRNLYWQLLPESTRTKLSPVVSKIRKAIV